MNNNKPIHDKRKICLHHIGGRNGRGPFPKKEHFESDFINVFYEADTDCISQIYEVNRDLDSQLIVLHYCVGSENKKILFNINYDPYTSSIYKYNPEFENFYVSQGTEDYLISDSFKTVEERELDVSTLDFIIENSITDISSPDFLSLDTQGSEFDILLGGGKTLTKSVCGLIIEVEFHPIYKGQKIFGDVCKLLSTYNFMFVKFLDIDEYSPHRGPVGTRGDGFQVTANALFLRKVDSINSNEEDGYIMLSKLVFFSIIFSQIEYALLCINQLNIVKDNNWNNVNPLDFKYLAFIDEFTYVINGFRPCFLPLFSMVRSQEDVKRSFSIDLKNKKNEDNPCTNKTDVWSFFIHNYKKIILLFKIVKKFGVFLYYKSKLIRNVYKYLNRIAYPIFACKYYFKNRNIPKYTQIELLVMRYGLTEQAKKVHTLRLKQQDYCTD